MTAGYVKVSGVWKQWFAPGGGGGTVTVPAAAASASEEYNPPFITGVTATLSFLRNGTTSATGTSPANWISPDSSTVGDSYEIRATVLSGDTPSGSALNTWLPLSSTRLWDLTALGPASSKSTSLTIEIGLLGTSTALSSNTCSIEASIS